MPVSRTTYRLDLALALYSLNFVYVTCHNPERWVKEILSLFKNVDCFRFSRFIVFACIAKSVNLENSQ